MNRTRAPFLIGLVCLLTCLTSYEQLCGQIVRRRGGRVGVGNQRAFGFRGIGRRRPAAPFPGSRMDLTVQGSLFGRSNYLNTYGSRLFAPPLAGNAVDPYLVGPSMPFQVPFSPLAVPYDGYGATVVQSNQTTLSVSGIGYAPLYQPLPIGRSGYRNLLGPTYSHSYSSGSVYQADYLYPRYSLIPRTRRVSPRNSTLTLPTGRRSTLIIPAAVTPTLYPAPQSDVATSLETAGDETHSTSRPLFHQPYHSRFLESQLASINESRPSYLIQRVSSTADRSKMLAPSVSVVDRSAQ